MHYAYRDGTRDQITVSRHGHETRELKSACSVKRSHISMRKVQLIQQRGRHSSLLHLHYRNDASIAEERRAETYTSVPMLCEIYEARECSI